MNFVKATLVTFSSQIATVLSGVAVTVLIARLLGQSGTGSYALIILVPTILVNIGNFGIWMANSYFSGNQRFNLTNIASNSLWFSLIWGIILSMLFVIYYLIAQPNFLREISQPELITAVAAIPFFLLTMYFSYILLAKQKVFQFNLTNFLRGFVQLVLVIILLYVFDLGILGTIVAWLIANIITSIIALYFILRITKIRFRFHHFIFRESLKFGLKGYLGNAIQLLNYRLDQLLVAHFLNAEQLSYYFISVIWSEALWYLPSSVGTIIFGRAPGMTRSELDKSTPEICRRTLFVTALGAITLFFISRYIIQFFYGTDWLPALQPLQILLPGTVAISICKVLCNEIAMRGMPSVNVLITGISLAVNLTMNLIFIPRWGISGAAFASTVAYTASAIVTLFIFRKISGNSILDMVVVRYSDLKIYSQSLIGIFKRTNQK